MTSFYTFIKLSEEVGIQIRANQKKLEYAHVGDEVWGQIGGLVIHSLPLLPPLAPVPPFLFLLAQAFNPSIQEAETHMSS